MIIDAIRTAANPGFRFLVEIGDIKTAVFTECTLPTLEWESQEVKEGGMNDYVHRLPVRQKGARITLKKGVGIDQLLEWCIDCMTMSPDFKRQDVTVILFGGRFMPLLTWKIEEAYPVKWTAPSLKSDDNTIAIQSLELAGNKVTISKILP